MLARMCVSVHLLAEVMLRHHVLRVPAVRERLLHGRWRWKTLNLSMALSRLLLLPDLKFCTTLLLITSTSIHTTVPPVLHSIVAASTKTSSDLCPSLAHVVYHLLDQDAFVRGDGIMIEIRFQILMIALSALFW